MSDTSVFWFRRDLRLGDNPALAVAAERGPVLGLFVVDEALVAPAGAARLAFLAATLDELDSAMAGRLVVRAGRPAETVVAVAVEAAATRVVATADAGPYGRRRDRAVAEALQRAGIDFELVDSNYAVAPGTVLTGGGTPYKVFTPFYRSWKTAGWAAPSPAIEVDWRDDVRSGGTPEAPAIGVALPPAGEAAAHDRLDAFVADGLDTYADRRDLPGVDGTSRLSPYLKWGSLHPRQILDRLGDEAGPETFRKELAWREFYADVLVNRPETAREVVVAKMTDMEVDEGPEADALFTAWAEGRTGYPIVDAGMRQLAATGWMHNRVRMICASFLVKDLHLDWRRGARWFMDQLVDGDLASNNHGWQWVAGTGTDAAPYFRIFNPTSQGKRFDPDGAYLRTWLPEIAHLGARHIHSPSDDPHGAPAAYPAPIVDHAAERLESLARYSRVNEPSGSAERRPG